MESSAQTRVARLVRHLSGALCNERASPNCVASSLMRLPMPPAPAPVSLDAWQSQVGSEIGVSSWLLLDQTRVDAFALATGDHQWIHGREARQKGSPFGGPIAHGFLVLSLAAFFGQEIFPAKEGAKMGVNFGIEKLRFTAPVPVGKRVRMRANLIEVKNLDGGKFKGVQDTIACVLEVEGESKASVTFHWLTRTYF